MRRDGTLDRSRSISNEKSSRSLFVEPIKKVKTGYLGENFPSGLTQFGLVLLERKLIVL